MTLSGADAFCEGESGDEVQAPVRSVLEPAFSVNEKKYPRIGLQIRANGMPLFLFKTGNSVFKLKNKGMPLALI